MNHTSSVRVLVVDHNGLSHAALTTQLSALGYTVVLPSAEPDTSPLTADVAIIDLTTSGTFSPFAAAQEIRESLPDIAVVLCTSDVSAQLSAEDAERSHAAALLLKPTPDNVLDATLRLAVLRAKELAKVRKDCEEALAQLEARKLIERAKGILMRRTGSSEQEAYRIMQRTSQDKSVPMVNIARTVIASEPSARTT